MGVKSLAGSSPVLGISSFYISTRSMSRATIITVLIVGVAGAGAVIAWQQWSDSRSARVSPPPELASSQIDSGAVDPQVIELVRTTVDEAWQSPQDPALRAKLAAVYHANGLLELAKIGYEQSLRMHEEQPRVWHHLALLHATQGDMDQAISCMARAIEFAPRQSSLRWRLGFWQLDQGLVDKAQDSFETAVQSNATEIAGRVGLARLHLQKQEYADAANILESVLARMSPNATNSSYIRQLLGAAERGLGRSGAVGGALPQGIGIEAEWPDPWQADIDQYRTGYHPTLKRIESDLAAGNTDIAIKRINDLLQRRPDDVSAMNYLAGAYFMKGQWDNGLQVLESALKIDPNHYPSHLNMTVGLLGKGDAERALVHAEAAVKANPTYADAYLRLGRVLLRLNRVQDAVEPLTKAVQFGANDAATRTMLGQTLLNLRKWDEAARVFSLAVQADAQHAPAHVGLAYAKAELGAIAEAKASLQTARQLDPNVKNLDKIAARVRELEDQKTLGPRLPR